MLNLVSVINIVINQYLAKQLVQLSVSQRLIDQLFLLEQLAYVVLLVMGYFQYFPSMVHELSLMTMGILGGYQMAFDEHLIRMADQMTSLTTDVCFQTMNKKKQNLIC